MRESEIAKLPSDARAVIDAFDSKDKPMPGDSMTEAELSATVGAEVDLGAGLHELDRRMLLRKDRSADVDTWALTLEGQGFLLLRRREEREEARPYASFPDFSEWQPLPEDMGLWDDFVAALKQRREEADGEAAESAVQVALRAAAVDTAAIEGLYPADRGFTISVAQQSAAWQAAFEERGPGAREIFEDQLKAFELVFDVATRAVPVSEAWLRSLHERACASQETYRVLTEIGWQDQPLPKGVYKTMPNSPVTGDGRLHEYAAPGADTQAEMARFVKQLASEQFAQAHPILQASYAHYALVAVHPFADGNGRVARALASVFFWRSYTLPLIVFVDQRTEYFQALELADQGSYGRFIAFLRDRGLDTIGLVSEALQAASAPRLERAVSRLKGIFDFPGGVTPDELTAIGRRLLSAVETALQEQFRELQLPENMVSLQVGRGQDDNRADSPYRKLDTRQRESALKVTLRTSEPAEFAVGGLYRVLASTDSSEKFTFRIERFNAEPPLLVRLDEIHPTQSSSLSLRLRIWVENHLGEQLENLATAAAKALHEGYQR